MCVWGGGMCVWRCVCVVPPSNWYPGNDESRDSNELHLVQKREDALRSKPHQTLLP